MANTKDNKKRIDPVTMGIAGAAAVVAGAAAVALSKKENRQKAGKILKDIKAKGEDLSKQASRGLDKVLKEEKNVRAKAEELRSKVSKVAPKKNTAKKSSAGTSSKSASTKKAASKSKK